MSRAAFVATAALTALTRVASIAPADAGSAGPVDDERVLAEQREAEDARALPGARPNRGQHVGPGAETQALAALAS
jgi:hypothetical protein